MSAVLVQFGGRCNWTLGHQWPAASMLLHSQISPGIADFHDQVHLSQLLLQIPLSLCNVSGVPLHHARLHHRSAG